MKTELRIPASEPYAYINLYIDPGEALTDEMIEEAVSGYRRATEALKGGEGLPDKEYNQFIDNMLSGDQNQMETYLKMNVEQTHCVQIIKRSIKRINHKFKE